jgi:uncharacterized membrane protein
VNVEDVRRQQQQREEWAQRHQVLSAISHAVGAVQRWYWDHTALVLGVLLLVVFPVVLVILLTNW